jgi:hypothetical protein
MVVACVPLDGFHAHIYTKNTHYVNIHFDIYTAKAGKSVRNEGGGIKVAATKYQHIYRGEREREREAIRIQYNSIMSIDCFSI